MHGLVIKNTGYWYTVLTDEGETIDCKIKGNFRLKGIRSTNPVAVGDLVSVSAGAPFGKGETVGYWITDIDDRKNYIIRKSTNLSKASHIIAANLDQACLVVTIIHPETSTTFIDRFLASAEAYRVPVILVFNKIDLLASPSALPRREGTANACTEYNDLLSMMMALYRNVGYECVAVSAETGDGIDELKPLLDGKVTLFSGNSGVGKSTLLNRIIPDINLRTADISDAHDTGMHTTTFSEMIPIPSDANADDNEEKLGNNGWVIDTPGIRGFGTFDMEPEEVCSYFKEIFKFSADCRFGNCTHTHEPGCAVVKAVEDHYIAISRYNSYLSILNDKEEGKYRPAY